MANTAVKLALLEDEEEQALEVKALD